MLRFLLPILALLFALPCGQALAWGGDGHKIVCEIAYRELNPKARDRVNQLMAKDPEFHTFATSCLWADKVGNSTRPETKGWHFINLPKAATKVNPSECPRIEGCILSAITLHATSLANPKTTNNEKLEALKYLGHWMGDLHQPLHLSYEEDRGGNYIPVRWRYFKDTDLHKIWDSEMIADAESLAHSKWKALAASLESDVTPADRKRWLKGVTLDWATETFNITRTTQTGYVGVMPNQLLELNEPYYKTNLPIVNAQLQKAGIRLGGMLNNILGR